MKNKARSVKEQVKALQKSIKKLGDFDGSRKAKLAKLTGKA